MTNSLAKTTKWSMFVMLNLVGVYIHQKGLNEAVSRTAPDPQRRIWAPRCVSNISAQYIRVFLLGKGRLREGSGGRSKVPPEKGEEIRYGPSQHNYDSRESCWDYQRWEKYQESAVIFDRALEGYRKSLGPEHKTTADIIYSFGTLYGLMSEYSKAETMFRQAIPLMKTLYGSESCEATDAEFTLGCMCYRQGKFDEQELIFERILPRYQEMLDPDDEQTLKVI
jgi:tetratricopeptide (TPR) repeat protein